MNIEAKSNNLQILTKLFYELRKLPIKDLLVRLRRAARLIQGDWGRSLEDLTAWLATYQGNRNIAAHGAFFPSENNRHLRVLYIHKRRDHGKLVYYPEEQNVSRELALELIADADRILRTVTALDEAVRLGNVQIGPPTP